MSRFNKTSTGSKTENLAGGEAFSQTPEMELTSILLTSFANDAFYRSADGTFERLKELIKLCDKRFVAKAAIYARTKFGMRSITHCVASELAKYISGTDWAKDFYERIIYRPDDMMEILSYHKAKNGKIPNSMKKGFAKAFEKFDAYSLAKYRAEGKSMKLVDVVNLVHPKSSERNGTAIVDLVNGTLKSFDTWENELSNTGQIANNEEEKAELKANVWSKLLRDKKIGYFALLRNLRNILEQSPDSVPMAIEMLTNEKLIKKSLVLPFRFVTAFQEVKKIENGAIVRSVLIALNKAVDISLSNVPNFDGDTLVVLDTSMSMRQAQSLGNKSPDFIGALFSSVLLKANNADFIQFDKDARYVNFNPLDSTITIADSLRFNGGGTNFHSIFQVANRKYDRIIILSDMQGWIGRYSPTIDFNKYKSRTGANPFIYSFDLAGYGSLQFPERNVFCLAGFSDKVFDTMALLEKDKGALVNEINKMEF